MSDLEAIVKLLSTQQHEHELFERHVAAVNSLCRAHAAGFALRDIPTVVEVLRALRELVAGGNDIFVAPACLLIRTLSQPYSKSAAPDELKLQSTITSLLTSVATYLQPGVPVQLQTCTAEMLATFASGYNNRPDALELNPGPAMLSELQPAYKLFYTHQRLVAHSDIIPAVCTAFQTVLKAGGSGASLADSSSTACRLSSDDAHFRAAASDLVAALLLAVLNFSYSSALCDQMLRAGVLPLVVKLLHKLLQTYTPCSDTSISSKLLTQAIELLWNLMELAPAAANDALLPLQQPKAPAASTMSARYASADVEKQQQQLGDQPEQVHQEQPWGSSTQVRTPQDIDMWVRPSCCTSAACSRPQTGLCDAQQALPTFSTLSKPSCSTPAPPADSNSRLPTAVSCSPGSSSHMPDPQTVEQQTQSPQLATDLVEALASLLKLQMADTSSKQAKEARNDTLAVLYYLSSINSCCAAISSNSLMPVLLAVATTPELLSTSHHVPSGAVSQNDADLELKLLVWGILGNAAANNHNMMVAAASGGFLHCLLLVADESDGTSCFAVGRWNPEQLASLRRMAWSILHQIAPACKAPFCSCNGVAMLMRHIAKCYMGNGDVERTHHTAESESLTAHFTGSMQRSCTPRTIGSLPRRSTCSSLEPALRLLQQLVAKDAAMATAFADAGVLPVLLQLLQEPVCCEAESAHAGVLLVLAELCEAGGSNCRNRLRQADGVALLLKECQITTGPDACPPGLLGLSALGCLWHCCLPSSSSRAQLLALDGMDMLLDVLQRGNTHFRPVVLSVLADLLSDRRSHPFFLEWHSPMATTGAAAADSTWSNNMVPSGAPGPVGITAAQLLLSIWREQDQALGLTGPNGVLINLDRPLFGAGAPSKWCVDSTYAAMGYMQLQVERKQQIEQVKAVSIPSITMDKVYACLCQLGYEAVSAGLSPADNAVFAATRQYLKFRQGEVWQDIDADFKVAGVTLTHEDRVRVSSGIKSSELLANQVAEMQRCLLAGVNQERAAAERAMYDAMLVQAEMDAKSRVYVKDSSKLTMRERLAAKARKEDMLNHSLAHSLSSATTAVSGADQHTSLV